MILVETRVFTREIARLLTDDEYRELQYKLIAHPNAGSVIRGSRGLRKLRWGTKRRGKRGGLRVIYFWDVPDQIFLLLPYDKRETEDLTKAQILKLRRVVEDGLK